MRILKFIIKILFKRDIYKDKNIVYMEMSIGLEADDETNQM